MLLNNELSHSNLLTHVVCRRCESVGGWVDHWNNSEGSLTIRGLVAGASVEGGAYGKEISILDELGVRDSRLHLRHDESIISANRLDSSFLLFLHFSLVFDGGEVKVELMSPLSLPSPWPVLVALSMLVNVREMIVMDLHRRVHLNSKRYSRTVKLALSVVNMRSSSCSLMRHVNSLLEVGRHRRESLVVAAASDDRVAVDFSNIS